MNPDDSYHQSGPPSGALPDPTAQHLPMASELQSVDPGKLRILVVDDEPTIRRVIGQVLRLDGHDPTEVGCAEDGLAAFRAQPFRANKQFSVRDHSAPNPGADSQ